MPPKCEGCGKPIVDGQARYTGGEGADPPRYWHWECHERWLAEFREKLQRFPETVARVQGAVDRLRRSTR